MIYTGVGSRETPLAVLEQMANFAAEMARQGWTLRSGGAPGADSAFEAGHRRVTTERLEIYLPWKGFNKNPSGLVGVSVEALQVAAKSHPAWSACSAQAQKLHGRNAYQVLGLSLQDPTDFVLCWTSDGATSRKERTRDTGGTGTAIVLAEANGVPVFNLARPGAMGALKQWLTSDRQPSGQQSLF